MPSSARKKTTSHVASPRARAAATPPAYSSATSPATSTGYCKTRSRFWLDRFFFYCYGSHRDLHSFPTRRSSDLQLAPLLGFLRDRHVIQAAAAPAAAPADDRKSTRLNSSPPSISYAALCLTT